MEGAVVSGPLFDGRADLAAKEGTDAIRAKLVSDARSAVAAVFIGRIRNSTGRFLASITDTSVSRTYTVRSGSKSYSMPVVVTDPAAETLVTTELASYGPWLEGTGSRNESTRFKGYQGFRLASQQVDRTAQATADVMFKPFAERMN